MESEERECDFVDCAWDAIGTLDVDGSLMSFCDMHMNVVHVMRNEMKLVASYPHLLPTARCKHIS